MSKAGRPTKKTDALGAKIIELYYKGKTDAQVSKIVGISKRALNYWKKKDPLFLHSIKEARDVADDIVEACLYARATGYNFTEQKVFCSYGNITEHKVLRHIPPDVAAGIYWLNNRRPEQWRNSRTVELPQIPSAPVKQDKNFTEFCIDANYPAPFEKQVEMLGFGFDNSVTRLLLGARGVGKTDYLTILGAAYKIYLDRQYSILIMTKSKERNTAIIAEISAALRANGVDIDKENSTRIRVNGHKGKDHSVSMVTVKTVSLRGRHPKMVILDDPVTEDDTSDATRLLVEKKYNELQKLTSNVFIIGQPAHKYDLYAKLRGIVKTMEVPHGSIPELDHDLQAQRAAGVDEASIQASYFLNIMPEGSTPFDSIKYIDKFPLGESAVAFIDPSHEGGDYTALTILRQHMEGIAVVGFCYKKAWNHCLEEMVKKMNLYRTSRIAFETNALGDQPIIMLRQLFAGTPVGVIGRRSNTQKHSRIMAAGGYAHLIHLSKESDKQYTDQVVKYEYKAKFDDAPDSLASCLEWVGLIRGKL